MQNSYSSRAKSSKISKTVSFYPTRFPELNYVQPIHDIKTNKNSVSKLYLEGNIFGLDFLASKKNKSLLCINLKLYQNEALSRERTHVFLERTFSLYEVLQKLNSHSVLIQQIDCRGFMILVDILFSWHMYNYTAIILVILPLLDILKL